jgi:hypothetical protein
MPQPKPLQKPLIKIDIQMKILTAIILVFITPALFSQTHNLDTLCTINKQPFRFLAKEINSEQVTLTIFRKSKIVKKVTLDSGGLADLKFSDFDHDGNIDITIVYMGNNVTYDLYLFDKKINNFKFIDDFSSFPEAIQLKTNPKFYYSYHRAGCADMNWVSDLFCIENFKIIHIGHISGRGCYSKAEPLEFKIDKVLNNDEAKVTLIEKLPYSKNISEIHDKWEFIEKYWNKNYKKFN